TNTYVPGALQVTKSIVLGTLVGTPVIPDFSITITGPSYPTGNTKVFNTANGLTQTWANLIPGAYTITEAAAGAVWSETVPAGAVTVAAGATAAAGVTNTYVPGALQVTKSIVLGTLVGTPVIPDFSITITGPSYPTGNTKVFNTANGLTQTWANLIPGAYTITEVSAGIMWSQTVPAGAVTVAAGATAVASVTNTYVPGALQVTKVIVLGDVVGTPAIPDFSITITGPSYPTGNTKVFNTANGLTQTWTNLVPGAYTITEAAAGAVWSETVPAGAVTVAADEAAAASVTNTYVPGALQVTKSIVLGDVVGTPVIPDFSITITGPSYPTGNTKVFNTANGLTQTWANLIPGAYTITEVSAGIMWSQTVPAGAVTVAAGATAVASVTNTYVPGALQVTKSIVLGDVVGTPVIPDFSITITGPSYPTGNTKVFNTANGLTQTWSNLIPGAYTITEAAAGAVWSETVPAGAVTVAAGATAAAGVTNTYVPGALQVTKSIVLGTLVGTPVIPDFSITITGPSYPTGNTKVFNTANGLTQTWSNLIPGAYTITEAAAGAVWSETVPAGAVTVAAGATAAAGVTNTYVPGALQVTKSIVLGALVGTPVIPDFSITITGPSYPTGNTKVFNTANGLTQTWANLIPGAYTITEAAAGAVWSETVPAGAVTVAAGATATASVTNTYVPGALQVTKSIVLVDVVGTPVIPDFSITITGPSYPTGNTKVFNTANGMTQTWTNLIPGAYTVTEAAPGGNWKQTLPIGSATVAAGATAAVTVTNTLTEVLAAERTPTPTPTTGVLGAVKTGESDNLLLVGGVSLLLLAGILIVLRRKWDELNK
ncbi:MAG: LPXTG cell wall anchor domain-containing protein, partial [Eubacteriales bacterium]